MVVLLITGPEFNSVVANIFNDLSSEMGTSMVALSGK
jgi:hypothetical protein